MEEEEEDKAEAAAAAEKTSHGGSRPRRAGSGRGLAGTSGGGVLWPSTRPSANANNVAPLQRLVILLHAAGGSFGTAEDRKGGRGAHLYLRTPCFFPKTSRSAMDSRAAVPALS